MTSTSPHVSTLSFVALNDHLLGAIAGDKNPRRQLQQRIPEAVWAEDEQRLNFYKETFMKSKDVYSFKILIRLCAVIP